MADALALALALAPASAPACIICHEDAPRCDALLHEHQHAHAACLKQWAASSTSTRCPICAARCRDFARHSGASALVPRSLYAPMTGHDEFAFMAPVAERLPRAIMQPNDALPVIFMRERVVTPLRRNDDVIVAFAMGKAVTARCLAALLFDWSRVLGLPRGFDAY